MEHYILEASVDSYESAMAAELGGANRIELCSNLLIGGTTPSLGLIQEVAAAVKIPIHILIRPRFGDFCYSAAELRIMRQDIAQIAELKIDGFVIGVLQADGEADQAAMAELIAVAPTKHWAMHRAFDVSRDLEQSLAVCREIGIQTILTSGGESNCIRGIKQISRLVELANEEINILVGAGVTAENISRLYQETKANHYHMSGKEIIQGQMEYQKEGIYMGVPGLEYLSEYQIIQTSAKKIRAAVERLDQL